MFFKLSSRSITCISLVLGFSLHAVAQDMIFDPRVTVTGADGHIVFVQANYYQSGELSKSTTSRLQLMNGSATLKLEPNFDGWALQVVNPTDQPAAAQLKDGATTVSSVDIAAGKSGILSSESIREPTFAAIDCQLAAADRDLVTAIGRSIAASSTQSIVSSSPIANIEWEVLDAYCHVLKETAGAMQELDFDAGWVAWDGSLSTRIVAGPIEFEDEHGYFKFTLSDGVLVDFEPYMPSMPEFWLDRPSELTKYREQAAELTQRLMRGKSEEAFRLFSTKFHEDVTVGSLRELSEKIISDYGAGAEQLASVDETTFQPNDSTRTLVVRSKFSTEGGKTCLSLVQFDFPAGRDIVSRGMLGSVQIIETFDSAEPNKAARIKQLLTALSQADLDAVCQVLLPLQTNLLDKDAAAARIEAMRQHIDVETVSTELWQWNPDTQTAHGPTTDQFGNEMQWECSFSEDQLLGLSMYGNSFAATTLTLATLPPSAADKGEQFWKAFLAGDLESAHVQLSDSTKEVVALEEFKARFSEGVLALPNLDTLETHTTIIAPRIEQPSGDASEQNGFALIELYVARFADGGYLPLRCDFVKRDGTWQLDNFSSNFEFRYPLADSPLPARLLNAFQSRDLEKVVLLTSDSIREEIDSAILEAFIRNLNAQHDLSDWKSASTVRYYRDGKCYDEVRAVVAKQLPVWARFEGEKLQAFIFDSPEASQFANSVADYSRCLERIEDFVAKWLSIEERLDRRLLIPEMKSADVLRRMAIMRSNLLIQHGSFESCEASLKQTLPESSEAAVHVELNFENGKAALEITVNLHAFGAAIAGIEAQ